MRQEETPSARGLVFSPTCTAADWLNMRNRFYNSLSILEYLGALHYFFGCLVLLPVVPQFLYSRMGCEEPSYLVFVVPSVLAFALGGILKGRRQLRELDGPSSMLLCSVAWILLSAVGAIPFCLGLKTGYLDAYFETVSGFTTTGITMLQGVDSLPKSILFWRSFIQWLGGLGILTFFLFVVSAGGSGHMLFRAESHKIFSKQPAPSIFRTLQILWLIYMSFTVLVFILLLLEGLSVFDAVAHALTCLSTGGYSPHDASIDFYRQEPALYNHRLIEYTIIFGMLLGGTNFFIHYRTLTGDVRALWDNFEVRLWYAILAGATALVIADHGLKFSFSNIEEIFRRSLFQVVALATTTGFATKDIGSDYFPSVAKQVFLILMVIGGCVGSTAGGIKVLRIGMLLKMVSRQINRVLHGRSAVTPVIVDKEVMHPEEIRRVSALFFAWIILLAAGGIITALLSGLEPMESASGVFSALGNIGPCYISVPAMAALHPAIKVTYIIGMLAGRLEILPVLLLFSRRAWM